MNDRRIGLVLGSGSARGWAHIGVIEALEEMGVRPSVVCGCSSGALVGASYAAGHLAEMERFARRLTWTGVLRHLDISFRGGGLIEGRWLLNFFKRAIGDVDIDALAMRYGAVATDLETGRETWLTSGSAIDAVRASIAIPGFLTPIDVRGRWLVDGALVNPLPVSLCRSLGADVIIGVNLGGDLATSGATTARHALQTGNDASSSWYDWMSATMTGIGWRTAAVEGRPMAAPAADRSRLGTATPRPGYFDVIGSAFYISQNFTARVRLAADPLDALIAPDVAEIGFLDFHRAAEAIDAGRAATWAQADRIRRLCADALVDLTGDAEDASPPQQLGPPLDLAPATELTADADLELRAD